MGKSTVDEILGRLQYLQRELEGEIDRLLKEKRAQFHYTLEQGRVRFEKEFKRLQKQHRTGLWRYLRHARLRHILTAPIIYSLIFPLLLLDMMVTFYQQLCFRIYGIDRVRRADYLTVDRLQLSYLNAIEKVNCLYCGYGNGVIEYSREISARTEQYWCPIKHAQRTPDPHHLTENFVDFGDAAAYRRELRQLRRQLRDLDQEGQGIKPTTD